MKERLVGRENWSAKYEIQDEAATMASSPSEVLRLSWARKFRVIIYRRGRNVFGQLGRLPSSGNIRVLNAIRVNGL